MAPKSSKQKTADGVQVVPEMPSDAPVVPRVSRSALKKARKAKYKKLIEHMQLQQLAASVAEVHKHKAEYDKIIKEHDTLVAEAIATLDRDSAELFRTLDAWNKDMRNWIEGMCHQFIEINDKVVRGATRVAQKAAAQ